MKKTKSRFKVYAVIAAMISTISVTAFAENAAVTEPSSVITAEMKSEKVNAQTNETTTTTNKKTTVKKVNYDTKFKAINWDEYLKYGHEAVAISAMLNFYGVKSTPKEIYNCFPKYECTDPNGIWKHTPYDAYVYTPDRKGYCYTPVIKKGVEKYLKKKGIKNLEVIEMTGFKEKDLKKELKNGNPVFVVGVTLPNGVVYDEFKLKDGSTLKTPRPDSFVVSKYAYSKAYGDNVYYMDDYMGGVGEYGPYSFAKKFFKPAGYQAIVIHKKKS